MFLRAIRVNIAPGSFSAVSTATVPRGSSISFLRFHANSSLRIARDTRCFVFPVDAPYIRCKTIRCRRTTARRDDVAIFQHRRTIRRHDAFLRRTTRRVRFRFPYNFSVFRRSGMRHALLCSRVSSAPISETTRGRKGVGRSVKW